MTIKVKCPSCCTDLRVPDTAAGKKIKCPKCNTIAPVPAAPASLGTAETLAKTPASAVSTVRTPRRTNESDLPPSHAEEEAARHRRRGKRAPAKSNRLGIGLAIAGAALGLLGVILIASFFIFHRSEAPVAAANPTKPPPPPEVVAEQPQEQVEPKAKPANVQFPIWRTQSAHKLKQLAVALHLFHDAHRNFPYAKSGPPGQKGQLSWRVAILPFLEQEPLYRKFKLDEPWDSPHNKQILDDAPMPTMFASPSDNPGEEKKTYYQIITGPQSAWPNDDARPRFPGSYPDGASNTFLIVEAKTPVYWTQPVDVSFDGTTVPPLGGIFNSDFHTALADGSVVFIRRSEIRDDTIRALITPAGGEVISQNIRD